MTAMFIRGQLFRPVPWRWTTMMIPDRRQLLHKGRKP